MGVQGTRTRVTQNPVQGMAFLIWRAPSGRNGWIADIRQARDEQLGRPIPAARGDEIKARTSIVFRTRLKAALYQGES